MSHSSPAISANLYRPPRLPRVIRRQLPMLRIAAVIGGVGILALTVTWRSITHERLSLDVGTNQSRIELLTKEVQTLSGQVESATSYPRIAKWAKDQRGWRALPGRVETIILRESELPPAARRQTPAKERTKRD